MRVAGRCANRGHGNRRARAFSFINLMNGWLGWMDVTTGDSSIIRTRDAGRHWRPVGGKWEQQHLQRVIFFDDKHAYGSEVTSFFRSDDGGLTWSASEIPDLKFIEQMIFLNREVGWLAATATPFTYFDTFAPVSGSIPKRPDCCTAVANVSGFLPNRRLV